jgi:hypothetical protein
MWQSLGGRVEPDHGEMGVVASLFSSTHCAH